MEDPLGNDGGGDPEALEVGQFFGLGGEPAALGVFEDVVEGEQPAHDKFRGCVPAMAVVLDPEGAVERSATDVADAGGPVAALVEAAGFADDARADEKADEACGRPVGHVVAGLVLGPDEDAGVEADEGEPVCLAVGPAEGAEGRGALGERGWRGGGGHAHDGTAKRYRGQSANLATGAAVQASNRDDNRDEHYGAGLKPASSSRRSGGIGGENGLSRRLRQHRTRRGGRPAQIAVGSNASTRNIIAL